MNDKKDALDGIINKHVNMIIAALSFDVTILTVIWALESEYTLDRILYSITALIYLGNVAVKFYQTFKKETKDEKEV